MCFVVPSQTLGAQAFIAGPGGFFRDAVFGRGTSQKIVDFADKAHRSTIGKVVGESNFSSLGFLPGTVPGPNASRGEIDFPAEKQAKRDAAQVAREARQRTALLLNNQDTLRRPSLLGN